MRNGRERETEKKKIQGRQWVIRTEAGREWEDEKRKDVYKFGVWYDEELQDESWAIWLLCDFFTSSFFSVPDGGMAKGERGVRVQK